MDGTHTLRELYEYITCELAQEELLDLPLLIRNNNNIHSVQIIDASNVITETATGEKFIVAKTPYYRDRIIDW